MVFKVAGVNLKSAQKSCEEPDVFNVLPLGLATVLKEMPKRS